MTPISIIIPTRLDCRRRHEIERALTSIRAQQAVEPHILIAANGPEINDNLAHTLEACADTRLLHLPHADLAGARLAGRRAVTTPFFCFLDDDDELLPGALASRLAPMRADITLDAVAGRGWRIDRGIKNPSGRRTGKNCDPLAELVDHGWLSSCSALYRSGRLSSAFFSDLPDYFEWTFLAFKLCLTRRIGFIDTPGHLIHDTPGSLSKSRDYARAQVSTLERILELDLPPPIRSAIRMKYGEALHHLADHYHHENIPAAAWRSHLKSLIQPGGLRFAAYTRKLLASSL